jgi:hypothetical protein
MDYPRRERLKILGHATVLPASDNPSLVADVVPAGVPSRLVERVYRIAVIAFDWNCPKYITARFRVEEIEKAAAPLKSRIAQLEDTLVRAGLPIPPT